MSTYFKDSLLLKTFVEVDTQMSHLSRKISSDQHLEIGDDPNLVQYIENALLQIQRKVKTIEPYFDLGATSLSRANIYFSLIKHITDAVQYLQDVRSKDYGSQQHTREFLNKLRNCEDGINAISDIIGTSTDIVH